MTSRIMLTSEKQIKIIRAHQTDGHLYYYPELSTVAALPPTLSAPMEEATEPVVDLEADALLREMHSQQEAKRIKLRKQRDAATRAERDWENSAKAIRDALVGLSRSPKSAGAQLLDLSTKTAAEICRGKEVLLHLLGDKKGQGLQFHALNVMTLCMLLGKNVGLNERELTDLAIGALAHDAGKAQIPPAILQSATRKKFEEDFYRQHVHYSLEFAKLSGSFSPEALAIIACHHEHIDGSGWPNGKKDLSKGARILALINRYDRLCTPEAAGREALMPTEALAYIFRNQKGKYDAALLSSLIRILGIYPPGTIVQLNDGTLALVVSPGENSLQPKVLIYSPEMAKDDAPTLELASDTGLKITEAIRPSTLPQDVLDWLNPQQRLSYYYSVADMVN